MVHALGRVADDLDPLTRRGPRATIPGMDTLKAEVCALEGVGPIPGADRIAKATAAGRIVVVGAEHTDGDVGVLFPAGGELAAAFAEAAGLRVDGGRVRAMKLRGVLSEGIWVPWDEFLAAVRAWDANAGALLAGDVRLLGLGALVGPIELERPLDGERLFRQHVPKPPPGVGVPKGYTIGPSRGFPPVKGDTWAWVSPVDASGNVAGGACDSFEDGRRLAWAHWRANRPKREPRAADLERLFPLLPSTDHLQKEARDIPEGATCHATAKIHGESWRLALVAEGGPRDGIWVGSRTVDFPPGAALPPGFEYLGTLRDLFGPRLRPGEVVYGEAAGFRASGRPIMRPAPGGRIKGHPFGAEIVYSYGCEPGGPEPDGGGYRPGDRFRLFAYRIRQGGRELTRREIVSRCAELQLEPVPPARGDSRWIHEGAADTVARARALAEGEDGRGFVAEPLDPRHPREGVVVRWETSSFVLVPERIWINPALGVVPIPGPEAEVGEPLKFKGWLFRALEGLAADDGRLEVEDAVALGEEVEP